MKLILGGSDDIPAKSSSDSAFQFYSGGDTIRVKNQRVPDELGYEGELCWSYVEGVASLHLCVVSASIDEDGEVLVPAVWHSLTLTPPPVIEVNQS